MMTLDDCTRQLSTTSPTEPGEPASRSIVYTKDTPSPSTLVGHAEQTDSDCDCNLNWCFRTNRPALLRPAVCANACEGCRCNARSRRHKRSGRSSRPWLG